MPVLPDPLALPDPPKPLSPDVRIVTPDGRPTTEYHRYLTLLYEWQRTLRRLLTV